MPKKTDRRKPSAAKKANSKQTKQSSSSPKSRAKPKAKRSNPKARSKAKKKGSPIPTGPGPHSDHIAAAEGVLKNSKHEAFAQAVAKGLTPSAAYRAASGKDTSSVHSMASRLLRKVKGRVNQLQTASATETVLTMQERREWIAKLVRTPIALIDEHHPLCQSVKYIESETGRRVEYKVADKLAAIMDDAKLSGELVEKVEHSGQVRMPMTLAEFEKRVALAEA